MPSARVVLVLVTALAALGGGCPAPQREPGDVLPKVEGLSACTDDVIAARGSCHTFRAITGASMGGGAAARIGLRHPELFDTVAIMGTPLLDMPALWNMLRDNQLGGFCDLEALEAALADDPQALSLASSFCGRHDVVPAEYGPDYAQVDDDEPATPDGRCPAFRSDFLHWYRGPDEGRGAPFDRDYLIQVFDDLLGAFGNPLTDDGARAQPGTDPATDASAACTAEPAGAVLSRESNPDGASPTLRFCDGAVLSGDWAQDDAHPWPMPFVLAVDLDEDGERDLGEPLVINDRERFVDAQPGGVRYQPFSAPAGTDGNGQWDEGEPFDDDGLDGVPGTGDPGEGNGVFDESGGLAAWRAASPTTLLGALSPTQLGRLSFWMDAGVRDFLSSAQLTNRFYGALAQRLGSDEVGFYQGFDALPVSTSSAPGASYEPAALDTAALPRAAYLQYGDPSLCPASDPVLGDGNHVGPDVLDRIFTLFTVAAARMPEDDRRTAIGGDITDMESPTGSLSDFAFLDEYDSEVLGTHESFGVMLPPDYYYDTERRYPVIVFLHGQGNSAQELVGIGFILWGRMKESFLADNIEAGISDMQRAILVFPDGQCRLGRCYTGTFYADFRDGARFESAVFEVLRVVEQRYRTLSPSPAP